VVESDNELIDVVKASGSSSIEKELLVNCCGKGSSAYEESAWLSCVRSPTNGYAR
tara:strand:+ start:389 stop:553 length:165 start_codon:yes stop_codon:yes gene_type:complete